MLKWTAACQAFARKSRSSDCRSHRYIASIDCPNDAGSAKTRIQPRKKQETKQTRKKTATLAGNDDDGQGRDVNSRGSKSFLLITQVSLAIGSDSVWPPRPMEVNAIILWKLITCRIRGWGGGGERKLRFQCNNRLCVGKIDLLFIFNADFNFNFWPM